MGDLLVYQVGRTWKKWRFWVFCLPKFCRVEMINETRRNHNLHEFGLTVTDYYYTTTKQMTSSITASWSFEKTVFM